MNAPHYIGKQVTVKEGTVFETSDGTSTTTWIKLCRCKGTATTDRFFPVWGHLQHSDGPVCDICHKPWSKDATSV